MSHKLGAIQLPSVSLPPLGATECEYKQVNGIWQNICQ